MSNSSYQDVTNDEMKEFLSSPDAATETAMTETTAEQSPAPKKRKKNVLYRLAAFFLAICPFAVLCLCNFPVAWPTDFGYETGWGSFIIIIIAMTGIIPDPDTPALAKLFEVIPTFSNNGEVFGWIQTVAFYLVIAIVCASFVLGVVALFSGKAAPKLTRVIVWLDMWAIGGYLMSYFTTMYLTMGTTDFSEMFTWMNVWPIVFVGFLALVGLALSAINSPKRVLGSAFLFLLSAAFNIVVIYAYGMFAPQVEVLGLYYQIGAYVLVGIGALGMLISSAMLDRKGTYLDDDGNKAKQGFIGNIVVAALHTLGAIALLVAYLVEKDAFAVTPLVLNGTVIEFEAVFACLIALGAIAVIELAVSVLRVIFNEKVEVAEEAPAVEEVAEETVEEVVEETTEEEALEEVVEEPVEETEEYEEAVPYEAVALEEVEEYEEAIEETEEEPVEEIVDETFEEEVEESVEETEEVEAPVEEVVEEEEIVEEAEEPAPAPVTPYRPAAQPPVGQRLKITDPFILTLTTQERQQFADIFMLKSMGDFPEIPDFKPNGDNSAFFRKLFVCLGKYRVRIPDDLLDKIYEFSIDQ